MHAAQAAASTAQVPALPGQGVAASSAPVADTKNRQRPGDGALLKEIGRQHRYHVAGRVLWGGLHHTVVLGAILLGAAATIIVGPESWASWSKDVALVLTAIAALLPIVGKALGADAKWRANADKVLVLNTLRIRAEAPSSDGDQFRDELIAAMAKHRAALAAAEPPAQYAGRQPGP